MEKKPATYQTLFFGLLCAALILVLTAAYASISTPEGPLAGIGSEITVVILFIAAFCIGLVLLGNYHIIKRFRESRQQNRELRQELREKEKMRSHLLEKVITSQEDERKRIARELHDETSQSLTSLMLGLKLIQQSDDLDQVKEMSGALRDTIQRTLEEIQRISFELRPSALDEFGLDAAIKRYVSELSSHLGVDIEFDLEECKKIRHNPVVETAVYRVVQEALTNAIRHSGAGNFKVWLRCNNDYLEAVVEDDGKGFSLIEEMGKRESLGIFGMKERAALVGGDLFIHTGPGKGTSVRLKIPLGQGEDHSRQAG